MPDTQPIAAPATVPLSADPAYGAPHSPHNARARGVSNASAADHAEKPLPDTLDRQAARPPVPTTLPRTALSRAVPPYLRSASCPPWWYSLGTLALRHRTVIKESLLVGVPLVLMCTGHIDYPLGLLSICTVSPSATARPLLQPMGVAI